MTKKITIAVTLMFLASMMAPVAFASEVAGTLSSGGVASSSTDNGSGGSGGGGGQTSGGTIIGSVVGGNTVTTTSGGGNNGGGGGTITSTNAGVLPTQTTTNGSGNGNINENALVATAPQNNGNDFFGTGGGIDETGDTVAIAPNTVPNTNIANGIPLGAAAGGIPLGQKISWILFGLAILAFMLYMIFKKRDEKKPIVNSIQK